MDLNGRRESDNIEDVRGQSDGGPIGRGGGFNIPGGIPLGGFSFRTIIIFAVIYFVAKLFFRGRSSADSLWLAGWTGGLEL